MKLGIGLGVSRRRFLIPVVGETFYLLLENGDRLQFENNDLAIRE